MWKTSRTILAATLFSSSLLTSAAFANQYVTSIRDNGNSIVGSENSEDLNGSHGNDRILSGGVSLGRAESIRSRGGADRLVFEANDSVITDEAAIGGVDVGGHIRIRDFIIDNTYLNPEADSVSLGRLIGRDDLDATNIGNYLHVISNNLFGFAHQRSIVFVNIDGDFSAADRDALSAGLGRVGGNGADLLLEFQGEQGNNNFETLTGYANNSVEQFQVLIEMGFLDLSTTNIFGSSGGDELEGTSRDEHIFSGGVAGIRAESVRGNGGADSLIFRSGDLVRNGHMRVRDFIIDDTQLNAEADSLYLGALIGPTGPDTISQYVHIVSGVYNSQTTGIYIKLGEGLTDADRQALDAGVWVRDLDALGIDLFIELQGQEADNNFETLTGFADNTAEQYRALIDWGFLSL